MYKSEIDKSYKKFLFIIFAILTIVCIVPLIFIPDWIAMVLLGSVYMLIVSYIAISTFSIRFYLEEEALIIRTAISKKKISYEDMNYVKQTNDYLSGYRVMTSKNGLAIGYQTGLMGEIKISPERQQEFLKQLKQKAPHIRIQLSSSEVVR